MTLHVRSGGGDSPARRPLRGVATAAALAVGLAAAATAAASDAPPVLAVVEGAVEVGAGEPPAWREGAAGQELAWGDRVRTGRGGRAEVVLPRGTVRLFENSVLHLPRPTSSDGADLEAGSGLFDVLRRGRSFDVRTPEVVVSVKGTRFHVLLHGDEALATVAVYRGAVGVRPPAEAAAPEVRVREGFAATGAADLPFELDVAPDLDPWQAWERSAETPAAALPDVEGALRQRSAAEARSVVRRETAGEVLARAAERRPELAARLRDLGETVAAEEDGGVVNAFDALGEEDPRSRALANQFRRRRTEEKVLERLGVDVDLAGPPPPAAPDPGADPDPPGGPDPDPPGAPGPPGTPGPPDLPAIPDPPAGGDDDDPLDGMTPAQIQELMSAVLARLELDLPLGGGDDDDIEDFIEQLLLDEGYSEDQAEALAELLEEDD